MAPFIRGRHGASPGSQTIQINRVGRLTHEGSTIVRTCLPTTPASINAGVV
jgi:hypothetical protein